MLNLKELCQGGGNLKLLILAIALSFPVVSFAMSDEAAKYKVKGAYLYNIKHRVESGEYFLPAAKEGDSYSQYYYAISLISRDGGLSNEAIGWLEKSANNGNLRAMFRLTGYKFCSYKKSCPPTGKSWFEYAEREAKKRADKGDGKAMYLLGIGYRDNNQKDNYYEWINRSAEAGYPRGQYLWAELINNGQNFYFTKSGRDEDVVKWARKAFDNGYPPSGYFLASKLWGKQEAWEAIEATAKSGYVDSIGTLATCYAEKSKYKICKNKKENKAKAVSLANYLEKIDESSANLYVSAVERRVSDEDRENSKKYNKWVEDNFKLPSYFEYFE